MNVQLRCPHCHEPRHAPAEWLGWLVRCDHCGGQFRVAEKPSNPAAGPLPAREAESPLKQSSTEEKMMTAGVPMRSDPMKVEELVDMTAMVDIVFFLLIFFLVTVMQQVISSMDLGESVAPAQTDRPGRKVALAEKPAEQITIRIDGDDGIWLNDEAIPSEQDLHVQLRDALENGSQNLLVLGHDDAHSFSLISVLDAGYEAGFEQIQMSVLSEDDWQTQGY